MISRRDLLGSAVVAGTLSAPDSVAASPRSDDSHYFSAMVTELREIRRAVSVDGVQAIGQVRAAQRTYLKNSGRFPAYLDVGYDVFNAIVDWLLVVRQPVTISRASENRYAVAFLFSTVVLRPDYPDNYVGQGYE